MSDGFFTITMGSEDATLSTSGLPEWMQDAIVQSFMVLAFDPIATDKALKAIQVSYNTNAIQQLTDSDITATAIQVVKTTINQHLKNVVELNMDGDVIAFDDKASFSTTKTEAKTILGSSEKISENEILIADSINQRAIIIDTLTNRIKWEYNSDRYVLDAHIIPTATVTLNLSVPSYNNIVINQNQIIIWSNDTAVSTMIYSGDVSVADMNEASFDPESYGTDFKSILLQPTERWAYKFSSIGEFNWFSYPTKTVGKILVSNTKISSTNQFIIVKGDGLNSSNTGEVMKIDAWGNVLNYFGNGYLVRPTDARVTLNGKVIVSV